MLACPFVLGSMLASLSSRLSFMILLSNLILMINIILSNVNKQTLSYLMICDCLFISEWVTDKLIRRQGAWQILLLSKQPSTHWPPTAPKCQDLAWSVSPNISGSLLGSQSPGWSHMCWGLGVGNLTSKIIHLLQCDVSFFSQMTRLSAPSKEHLWHFYRINALRTSFLPKEKANYPGTGLGLLKTYQ